VKGENTKLKDELLLESKYSTLPSNPAATAQIAKLQDQADMFTRKIELEKRRVAELDKQIAVMQAKIMGGEVRINRSTYHVKPFYLSSETVLPLK
jgi:peptidoglycan hydrolase CwlO-like protein